MKFAIIQNNQIVNAVEADAAGQVAVSSGETVLDWTDAIASYPVGGPLAMVIGSAQLLAYAKSKASTIESGGITVNIGAAPAVQNVECATDNATYLRLMAANSVAQANPSKTQNYPFPSGVVTLTATQVESIFNAVTDFYSSVTTTLAAVISAINAGTVTTTAQVDSFSSPAWPANS